MSEADQYRSRSSPAAWLPLHNAESSRPSSLFYGVVFLLLAMGIVIAALMYFRRSEAHFREEVERQLTAIATLKVDDLVRWRKERLGDGAVFHLNADFSDLVRRSLAGSGDKDARDRLRIWLTKVQTAHGYDRVCLQNAAGVVLMSVPEAPVPFAADSTKIASEALGSGHVTLSDFSRNEHDLNVYLWLLIPILDKQEDHPPLGALVLRIDPHTYLYPLIQRWPTTSRTAETLLIRREVNEAVFLNDLRFKTNTALNLRLSLDRREMSAVKAAMGREGVVEGLDYRGMPVLACIRAVPDSPWFLVARVDASEVYAPLRQRMWALVGVVSLLLTTAAAILGLLWRQRSVAFYRNRFEAAEKLRHLNEVLRAIRNVNQLITHERDRDRLLRRVCEILTETRGYRSAWIALCEAAGVFQVAAESGIGAGFDSLRERLESGDWPECCRQALERPGVIVMRDTQINCTACPLGPTYRETAAFASALRHAERTYGVLVVALPSATADDDQERSLFHELAGDVSYALHAIEVERQRKRAEQALLENNAIIRGLLDAAPESLFLMDPDGTVLAANENVAKRLGKTVKELEGHSIWNALPPEVTRSRKPRIDAISRSGKPDHFEDERSGRAIESIVHPVLNEQGKVIRRAVLGVDITERKRTEVLLQQSLDQTDLLLRTSSYILYRCEAFGDFDATYVSDNIEPILGYKPDDFLQKGFWAGKIHPEDAPRIFSGLDRFFEYGVHKHEYRFQHKNGSWRWIYDELRLNRDNLGKPKDILGSMVDITERKKADQALAIRARIATLFLTVADEEMFSEGLKVVLDIMDSPFGVFGYIDEDGALVVPTMTRQVWDRCLVAGKDVRFPRGTWGDSSWPRAIREKRTNYRNEASTKTPEGHVTITRHVNVPIVFHDDAIGLLQVANKETDYTETNVRALESIADQIAPLLDARLRRERAEKGLQRTNVELEQRVDARTTELRRRNRELSILYQISRAAAESLELQKTLNRAFEATLDALNVEAGGIYLLAQDGETLSLRAHRGLSDEFIQGVQRLKPGEGIGGAAVVEKKPIVHDVSEYPTERLTPLILSERLQSMAGIPLLSSGQAVGALNLATRRERAFPPDELELLTAIGQQLGGAIQNVRLHDIAQVELAERKRAEEVLRRRTIQLEAANKELEAFSYSVSHDLRAPLRGIDGWSLALMEDYHAQLDDQARRYLDRVRSEAQRMGRLIDDLLQLSRVSRADMRVEAVDLSALARAIVARLEASQPERRVECVVQSDLFARGDARLIEIALANLLDNAWKFTAKRDAARIEFGRTEADGRTFFFVRDNGVGFDMKFAEKLFGAFQRMHRTSEYPGTGIGLATVQRIIHRHGGRIWVEAAVDQGTTFYFTLEEAK